MYSQQVISEFTTINSNTGCGSLVVEFQDMSNGNPNAWLWDFGNGYTSTQQNPIVFYNSPGYYRVELTVSNGIDSSTKSVSDYIQIHDNPSSNFFTNNSTNFCAPFEISFSNNSSSSSNITQWVWDFGDGGGSFLENPVHEYSDTGDFSVSLFIVDDKGCDDIIVMNNFIKSYQKPESNFSSNIQLSCSSSSNVSFVNLSLNSLNYYWDFGDGSYSYIYNPTHNFSTGTYNIQLISDNGFCSDTLLINDFIEIGASVVSEFSSDITSGCDSVQVNFFDMTTYDPDYWLWDFGDGNVSYQENPTHIFDSSGSYAVTLTTSKNGDCIVSSSYNNYINIYKSPTFTFDVDTQYGCSLPFHVSFSDINIDAVEWVWSFGNGDSSFVKNTSIIYDEYGEFDIFLEVKNSNGCISSFLESDFIMIDSISVNISASEYVLCNSGIVYFDDISFSESIIDTWSWDFGNGLTDIVSQPNVLYDVPGYYDVNLTVNTENGCQLDSTFQDFIRVDGPPTANFQAFPLISCAGEYIDFLDLTYSNTVQDWYWDFGDGNFSNLQNPTHQYNSTGIYDVSLFVGEGDCVDTFIINNYIQIIEPSAFFEPAFNCEDPYQVEFINLSEGADNVFWDFDDGTTSTQFNPIHTFPDRGIYYVRLRVNNDITGCTHEFIKKVRITKPEANFTYLINANNSLEDSIVCAPRRVHLDNLSIDCSFYKVKWEDGYVGHGRLDHLFTDVGVWDVSMIVTDIHYCKDTFTINDMYRVTDVVSDFDIVNSSGCDSLFVDFVDLSSVPSVVRWDFGDGTISSLNNPQNIYHYGSYDVTLYSTSLDGCRDTLIKNNYINFQPMNIDFSISDSNLCLGDSIYITDLSTGKGLSYNWNFGDGTSSNLSDPKHYYIDTGYFQCSLILTDSFGCVDNLDASSLVKVQYVKADFSSNIHTSMCPPLIAQFTDLSVSNISTDYYWDFGDFSSSYQKSPSHVYSDSGNFAVRLIVVDDLGCSDTLIRNDMIIIENSNPSGIFSVSDDNICIYDSIHFMASFNNADYYYWDFGDGVVSNSLSPHHIYNNGGYYNPVLILENNLSCRVIIDIDDDIFVKEVIVDAGLDQQVCFGDSLHLNAVGTDSLYKWFSDIFILDSLTYDPIILPDSSGFVYVYNSDGSCQSTDSLFIFVDTNIPSADFVVSNQCFRDSIIFSGYSGLSTSNIEWEWEILGNYLFDENVSFVFDSVSEYIVNLKVNNLDNNCSDIISKNVNVLPLPSADFSFFKYCYGDTTLFLNLSSDDVVSSIWDFNDGASNSSLYDSHHRYSEAGIFFPELTVFNSYGCFSSITRQIEIYDLPEFSILVENNCAGDSTEFQVIFNNLISHNFIYNWDFGDNSYSVDSSTFHVYDDFGKYYISLHVESDKGCKSINTDSLLIHPLPEIDFDIVGHCFGSLTNFINKSFIKDGYILDYHWDIGDFSRSIKDFSHTFDFHGNYDVRLLAVSDRYCENYLNKNIVIYDIPRFDISVDSNVCLGDAVNFIFLQKNDQDILSVNWNFGNNYFSDILSPSNIYHNLGKYDVSLYVESLNGCKDSLFKNNFITVHDHPVANFDFSNSRVSDINPIVDFFNHSDEDLLFEWDFDNGIINNTDDSLSVKFYESGIYLVSLYVENEFGCFDNVSHDIEIFEDLRVFIPNAFSPNNDGLNDYFIVEASGFSQFDISIYNRWGDVIYSSYDIGKSWDGTNLSGDKMNSGTYIYQLSITDYNNKLSLYNGEINLIR